MPSNSVSRFTRHSTVSDEPTTALTTEDGGAFYPPTDSSASTSLYVGLGVTIPLVLILLAVLYVYRGAIMTRCSTPHRSHTHTRLREASMREAQLRVYPSIIISGDDIRQERDREFQQLQNYAPSKPSLIAQREENYLKKNRYTNALPFDYNLVHLRSGNYVNASHILPNFIATQDPMTTEDDDFWPMIWEHKVHIIVRLSSDSDEGQMPCAVYIPPRRWVLRDMDVTKLGEDDHSLTNCVRRTIRITDTNSKAPSYRDIFHYHLTCWDGSSLPPVMEFLMIMQDMRRRKSAFDQYETTRTLVHCGAGAGRTGTFIAIWILLDASDEARKNRGQQATPYSVVRTLKDQRPHMVNKKELYDFIHQCVDKYTSMPIPSVPPATGYELVKSSQRY